MPPHLERSLLCLLLAAGAASCSPSEDAKGVAAAEGGPEASRAGGASAEWRVAICGHLYSLYVPTKREDFNDRFGWESPLRALGTELRRLAPDLTFFLGDSTRYSSREEWDYVDGLLSEAPGKLVWVAGNHEERNEKAFDEHGGTRNDSFVVGPYKFVTLDAKTVYGPEDLAFLERELEDREDHREVFLLMHFFLAQYDSPEPDQVVDPRQAYSGYSNWNRDVVPLLAGRVSTIFCGDYAPFQMMVKVQRVGEHELRYVLNSFLFGRGRYPDQAGDGPMTFLELVLRPDGYEILPRIVPLELRDPWYASPCTKGPWLEHELEGGAFGIALPADWHVEEESATRLVLRSDEVVEWKRRRVEMEVLPGDEDWTPERLAERVRAEGGKEALAEVADAPLLRLAGRPVPWFVGTPEQGTGVLVTICLSHEGRAALLRIRGPAAEGGTPGLLLEILETVRVGDATVTWR